MVDNYLVDNYFFMIGLLWNIAFKAQHNPLLFRNLQSGVQIVLEAEAELAKKSGVKIK